MLSDSNIETIIQTIVRGINPDKIFLFGSYANGLADENSDLDLAVIKETNLASFERSLQVKQLFRKNKLKFPMDIIVLNKSELEKEANKKYSLSYEILHKGKLMYDRQSISS